MNDKVKMILIWIAGVLSGGLFAYIIGTMMDADEREARSWERAWTNSTYPVNGYHKFDGDDEDKKNGNESLR